AGTSRAIRIAMIAMTTNSSTSVNAGCRQRFALIMETDSESGEIRQATSLGVKMMLPKQTRGRKGILTSASPQYRLNRTKSVALFDKAHGAAEHTHFHVLRIKAE